MAFALRQYPQFIRFLEYMKTTSYFRPFSLAFLRLPNINKNLFLDEVEKIDVLMDPHTASQEFTNNIAIRNVHISYSMNHL